jgi:hypothetical protein
LSAADELLIPAHAGAVLPSSANEVAGALATGVPGVSPEQITGARANWIKLGYSPEAFDAAMSGTAPAAPVDAPIPKSGFTSDGRITVDQARTMAEQLLANGVPREQIEAALAYDNISLKDAKSLAEQEADLAFQVNAAPEEYHVNYGPAAHNLDTKCLAAFDNQARGFLSAAGIAPGLGESLLEHALETGRQFAAMTPSQRSMWKIEQKFDLHRQLGSSDAVDAAIKAAASVFQRAGVSDFSAALQASGALNSSYLIRSLANHAELLAARAKVKAA